jgi:hypothetical protein
MGNHFHLLVETPEANLVSGMKLLLGAFGAKRHGAERQAFSRRQPPLLSSLPSPPLRS